MKVLAISTSASRYEKTGHRTGMWLGEYTHFYDELTESGHDVTLASITGGEIPIDPVSLQPPVINLGGTSKRYQDREFMSQLDDTPAVADLNAEDFDAVYLIGGHGTLFDFDDPALKTLLADFTETGTIVSAVCHGPAGLLDVPLPSGSTLLSGKKATGYTWTEEKLARRADAVPYSLEEKLEAEAGEYTTATIPMTEHVVTDGTLVTGQNPMSAAGVGKEVVRLLAERS